MLGSRGKVVLGAVVLAGIAFFLLMRGGGGTREDLRDQITIYEAQASPAAKEPGQQPERVPLTRTLPPRDAPALDDIDAESRAKMRELLREAG